MIRPAHRCKHNCLHFKTVFITEPWWFMGCTHAQ